MGVHLMQTLRFSIRSGLSLLVGALLCTTNALAQATGVSDQLIATLPGGTSPYFSGSAGEPPLGQLEAPIGFARVQVPLLGWRVTDMSSFISSAIGLTATTVDDAKFTAWEASIMTSGTELFLTEPNAAGTVSDVIFRFSTTVTIPLVGTGSGDAIVMFSDPVLVAKLAAMPHLNSFASIAETGSLQEINSILYGTTNSPFSSIQVYSAVPEPSGLALMFVGMGFVGGAFRRRHQPHSPTPESAASVRR
jgi:hypothetical protein